MFISHHHGAVGMDELDEPECRGAFSVHLSVGWFCWPQPVSGVETARSGDFSQHFASWIWEICESLSLIARFDATNLSRILDERLGGSHRKKMVLCHSTCTRPEQ